ncbi:nuclease-related domain-containing protein [Lysobacter sp. Hz 25]|uniref:nuclease-related domain-containing protein n=1 Tax=Lysobacter sp. Hz 25 TaxID=3383698 RepID=UPI0038D46415
MDSILLVLAVAASIFIPTLMAIGALWGYKLWRDRQGRRSPLADRRIHGAGEQLRKRIEDHTDSMLGGLIALFFLGPYFLAAWALPKVEWGNAKFGVSEVLYLTAFLVMAAFSLRRIIVSGNARRRGMDGLKAEMFVAQELNRLIGLGATVLHDVPCESFNLDHVVIGRHAVFVIETKSVRKPPKTGSKDHFKVAYDGERLRFPDHVNAKAIAQARQQAGWLAAYLRQMNIAVPVKAAVALPGWWIDSPRLPDDGVRVFNPAGRGAHFMADARLGATPLSPTQIGVITQALIMRYPVEA